jgi:tetratricopeptide (TPR) repeat protein
LDTIYHLAEVYDKNGKHELAESLFLEYLEKQKFGQLEIKGADFSPNILKNVSKPSTSNAMKMLAALYKKKGKNDLLESLYLQCLSQMKIRLGERHPDTLEVLEILAKLYKERGSYYKAMPFFEERVISKTEIYGEKDQRTIQAIQDRDMVYFRCLVIYPFTFLEALIGK